MPASLIDNKIIKKTDEGINDKINYIPGLPALMIPLRLELKQHLKRSRVYFIKYKEINNKGLPTRAKESRE